MENQSSNQDVNSPWQTRICTRFRILIFLFVAQPYFHLQTTKRRALSLSAAWATCVRQGGRPLRGQIQNTLASGLTWDPRKLLLALFTFRKQPRVVCKKTSQNTERYKLKTPLDLRRSRTHCFYVTSLTNRCGLFILRRFLVRCALTNYAKTCPPPHA
jgi:hypothetical protein